MEEVGATIITGQVQSAALVGNAGFQREMGHISRHSFVFFLGTMFTALTGYVFKIYLARALGAEALGLYALGMTIVGLLSVFDSFGLPQAAVRFVAAYRATGKNELLRSFLSRAILLLLISNVGLGVLLLLAGPLIATRFYHSPTLGKYFTFFAAIMLLGTFSTFLAQVLTGYKDVIRRTVITNFVGSSLTIGLSVGLITLGWNLRGYLFAQVLSAAIVVSLLSVSVARLLPPSRGPRYKSPTPFEAQVVSFSVFAFGVSMLEFLMAQSDKVLIGFYLNARDVGIYSVAMALVAFVSIVLQSVNQIFSPVIADLHARNEHVMLARIFQTLAKWSLGLTLPLAAVMIIFSPVLMHVFGPDFASGWPILVIGTIGQLVNCGVGSVGYMLLMSGHQRELVKIQTVMALLMVAMGILLTSKFGVLGAAVAAAIVNLISNVWYLREVRHRLQMTPYNLSYFRLILPVAGTVLVLLLERRFVSQFHSDFPPIAMAVFVGYASFLALAIVAGLDSDDRIVLKAIWLRTGGVFFSRGQAA